MGIEKLQYHDFVAAANLLGSKHSLRLKEGSTDTAPRIATSWLDRARVRYHDFSRSPDEIAKAKSEMLEAFLKQADQQHGSVVKMLVNQDVRLGSDGKPLQTLKAGYIKAAEKQNNPMTPVINDQQIRWAAYGEKSYNPAASADSKPTGRSLLETLPEIVPPLMAKFKENDYFSAEDLQSLKERYTKASTMAQVPDGLPQEIERALRRQAATAQDGIAPHVLSQKEIRRCVEETVTSHITREVQRTTCQNYNKYFPLSSVAFRLCSPKLQDERALTQWNKVLEQRAILEKEQITPERLIKLQLTLPRDVISHSEFVTDLLDRNLPDCEATTALFCDALTAPVSAQASDLKCMEEATDAIATLVENMNPDTSPLAHPQDLDRIEQIQKLQHIEQLPDAEQLKRRTKQQNDFSTAIQGLIAAEAKAKTLVNTSAQDNRFMAMSLNLFIAGLTPKQWGLIGVWLMNNRTDRLRSEFAEKNTPDAVAKLDQLIAAFRSIDAQPSPNE